MEICYISIEGLTVLYESQLYKDDKLEKTFTKFESTIRNFQIDACQNETYPILFGPKDPFRNIERDYRAVRGMNLPEVKEQFLKVWICMSEDNDGAIVTRKIEDIQIDVKDMEIAFNIHFVSDI